MPTSYQEVKADLLRQITEGHLPLGGTLPNEADLAVSYGCARSTVNRAMRELAADGLIERRRKAGSRVRQSPVRQAKFAIPLVQEEIQAQGAAYQYTRLTRAIVTPDALPDGSLALGPTDRILHLTCLHSANGAPYQYENRWINLNATPEAESQDFTQFGPNAWLVEQIPFTDVTLSFGAVSADAGLAKHLGAQPGDALFRVERATHQDARPVTFVQLTYRHGHRMTTTY